MCKRRKRSFESSELQEDVLLLYKKKRHLSPILKFDMVAVNELDKILCHDIFNAINQSNIILSNKVSEYIVKNITEYALGWIKPCPSCVPGEILILASSFEDTWESLKCIKCNTSCFVHCCDECHDLDWNFEQNIRENFYWYHNYIYKSLMIYHQFPWSHNDSWWISDKLQTEVNELPTINDKICTQCIYEEQYPLENCCNGDLAVPHPEDYVELCDSCTFVCFCCNNRFCKREHLANNNNDCNECNAKYCQYCQAWANQAIEKYLLLEFDDNAESNCINCFCRINLKIDIANLNYGLKDVIHSKLLQKVLFKSKYNLPHLVIDKIVKYCNAFVSKCADENCNDGHIVISYQDIGYFNTGTDLYFCNSVHSHRNYIHFCYICKNTYWINTIPSYLYFSILDLNFEQMKQNVCHYCIDPETSGCQRILKKLCNDCSFECGECQRLLCIDHFGRHCLLCDTNYCIFEMNETRMTFYRCQLCQFYACTNCQIYYHSDGSNINCYKLYEVCHKCYSENIANYYPKPSQYKSCLQIVNSIINANTELNFLELYNIIDIIAIYASTTY